METCSKNFEQICEDFGLTITHHSDCDVAKFQNFPGFVIATNHKDGGIIAAQSFSKDEKVFWGAKAYYDEEPLKEHVAEMIQDAKDCIVENKLDNIKKDFDCNVNIILHKNSENPLTK